MNSLYTTENKKRKHYLKIIPANQTYQEVHSPIFQESAPGYSSHRLPPVSFWYQRIHLFIMILSRGRAVDLREFLFWLAAAKVKFQIALFLCREKRKILIFVIVKVNIGLLPASLSKVSDAQIKIGFTIFPA